MRCILCSRWSFAHICTGCQERFLKPDIKKFRLFKDFEVVSFYGYSEIEELLKTKHTYVGAYIYKILAANSFKIFAKNFTQKAFVVPVDDKISGGYSHTAILAKSLKSGYLKPLYNVLPAKNRINYSGKPLDFRLKNPRDFQYRGRAGDIVLVDDIITTGTTLKEAYSVLKKAGANPLFALTLATAKS